MAGGEAVEYASPGGGVPVLAPQPMCVPRLQGGAVRLPWNGSGFPTDAHVPESETTHLRRSYSSTVVSFLLVYLYPVEDPLWLWFCTRP